MRNVMLIATILSVMPGFVCGMERGDKENGFLLISQVKPVPMRMIKERMEEGANACKEKIGLIKEDVNARKEKISSAFVGGGCPKRCADVCGACESICCCGCLHESVDRFTQEGDFADVWPTVYFLAAVTPAVAAFPAGSNMTDCFHAWMLPIHARLAYKWIISAVTWGKECKKKRE